MDCTSCVQIPFLNDKESETKVVTGQKRSSLETEETCEDSDRRVKMRDLESIFQSEGRGENKASSVSLDLSAESCAVNFALNSSIPVHVNEELYCGKEEKPSKENLIKSRSFDFDLNADNMPSSVNNFEHSNFVVPSKERDSMTILKGLKQNNYLSYPYKALPLPRHKPYGRKRSSNDAMKKIIELEKREQTGRLAGTDSPSGLLNGLNLGIINHVRNSKQVRTIIENVVKSEGFTESKEQGNACSSSKLDELGLHHGDSYIKSGSAENEDVSYMLNDESDDIEVLTSLSIEAANAATKWLELLNRDIRGRLAALKRSKKRVCTAIYTELPLLMSREFSHNPQKDAENNTIYPDKAMADAHSVKWGNIFRRMEKALHEEEKTLESWLNKLKQVESHCEKGLKETNRFEEETSLLKNFAVRAAAASMYSTCNYLVSADNLPCC